MTSAVWAGLILYVCMRVWVIERESENSGRVTACFITLSIVYSIRVRTLVIYQNYYSMSRYDRQNIFLPIILCNSSNIFHVKSSCTVIVVLSDWWFSSETKIKRGLHIFIWSVIEKKHHILNSIYTKILWEFFFSGRGCCIIC